MKFNNKVVIVTGASSGIGAAVAMLFAKEGADLAIVARTQAKLDAVAKQVEKHGRKALVIKADLSKDSETATVVYETVKHFGKLDVLVNNAGFFSEGTILKGNALQAYDEVMQVNIRSVVHLTMLATPHLIHTKGNVVNISSVAGFFVNKNPNFHPYAVSKAALNHFSRCAALELAAFGVRVNSVSAGPVDNEFLSNSGFGFTAQFKQGQIDATALGRLAKDDEIGELVLFIASDSAKSITGSNYLIDNGYLLQK